MATMSEKLREGSIGWTGDAYCVDGGVAEEAADLMDEMAKALERARDQVDAIGWTENVGTTHITDEIDAILTRFREAG